MLKPDFKKNDLVWYIHPTDRVIRNGVISDINEMTKYWVNPEYYVKGVGSCRVSSSFEMLLAFHTAQLLAEIQKEKEKIEKSKRNIKNLEKLIKINKEIHE